jgi:UDP-N-acetylmuramate dehydrogenase
VPDIADTLEKGLPGVTRDVPLAPRCAYRVGGPADYLYLARTTADLLRAVTLANELELPLTVLGQATNVLVGDAGVRGLVVFTRNAETTLDGEVLTAGAGALLPEVVTDLAEQGLAGLEFAGNIPGSIGGAVVGNAGAYGRAVGDALVDVRAIVGGQAVTLTPADLRFGYRSSALKHALRAVVVSARFALAGGTRSALLTEIARDAELRRRKHPLEYGSCGSFFKNSSPDLPAARLIEEAGFKGRTIGRAQVSDAHANFIVALPGATADDIRALADEVVRVVYERSGVTLEREVTLVGFD